MSAAAVFLDRDGTLILDKPFLCDPAGVELAAGAADAVHRLRAAGYKLFLFTNQSGIDRGYFTREQAEACNAEVARQLGLTDGFDGICIAPERPDEPPVFRKPSPRYITETMASFGLVPSQCWMVGDRESDVEAGIRAGIRSARIRSEPGGSEYTPPVDEDKNGTDEVRVFASVADFAEWLLNPDPGAG